MKSAVDRTYTTLCGLMNADITEHKAMLDALAWYTPRWDRPQFDPGMLKAIVPRHRQRRMPHDAFDNG